MMPLQRCPVCRGELSRKRVEKLLRGGGDTAVVEVDAEVCRRCGERLYAEDDVRWFEDVRRKLERGQVDHFQRIGRSFQVSH